MKIRPVGAELFLADGQTDVTYLIIAFQNFANVPKMPSKFTLGNVSILTRSSSIILLIWYYL